MTTRGGGEDRRSRPVHLALGDSLSAGTGDLDAEGRPIGWARRTSALLGAATGSRYAVATLAAPRATLADVVARQVPAAVRAAPDLVTLTVGVNDLQAGFDARRFASDVDDLLAALVGTGATVLTMTVPDVAHMLPLPPRLRTAVHALLDAANEGIRRGAGARGALLLDADRAPEILEAGFWHADGMHPTGHGHRLIARAAADLLLAAGPRRGLPPRVDDPVLPLPRSTT